VEKGEAGQYILTLHIDANALEAGQQLPDQIEGCPVKVVQSGPFRKLPAANQSEYR
jgi:electron transfer flavoprotein alpha/beta subunit